MDTKALLDIYRKEKMSPYLQSLDEDFYGEVRSIISELESGYSESKGETKRAGMLLKELDNVKSVIEDLYEIRERKVVLGALNLVRRDDEEIEFENFTKEEQQMLEDVAGILKKNREAVLHGKGGKKMRKTNSPPKKKETKKEIEVSLVTVRISKDLPAIVGADGKVYGAFQEEDVVSLPDANARALIEQGAAEEIKL